MGTILIGPCVFIKDCIPLAYTDPELMHLTSDDTSAKGQSVTAPITSKQCTDTGLPLSRN